MSKNKSLKYYIKQDDKISDVSNINKFIHFL